MQLISQPSLLDGLEQPSERRRELTHGAWVDVVPGWWPADDGLLGRLVERAAWRAERRQMYERVVDVPRLVAFYDRRDVWPDPALHVMRERLSADYSWVDGPLVSAGLCLYRDGEDSVAWHGDRIGRGRTHDTVVAIVSLGAPRALLLRPREGGTSLKFVLGHGDLLVMGGSCQRTWEHAVPKTTKAAGPRVSVQLRPAGVR